MNIFYLFFIYSALADFLCLVFIVDFVLEDYSVYFIVILFHLDGLSVLECYNFKK